MKKRKTQTRLYNVLFPFWMLLLFPQMWLIILPGNFLIDSLVLVLSMAFLKLEDRKQFYKKHILKIFAFGMLADLIGAAYLLLMVVLEVGLMGDELYMTLPALVISAGMIFVFNYFITFRKEEISLRRKLALVYTLATAPYTFLIPSSWLYG